MHFVYLKTAVLAAGQVCHKEQLNLGKGAHNIFNKCCPERQRKREYPIYELNHLIR